MRKWSALVDLSRMLPFEVNLWSSQNLYWEMLQNVYPEYVTLAGLGEPEAVEWVQQFRQLGENLWIQLPALEMHEA